MLAVSAITLSTEKILNLIKMIKVVEYNKETKAGHVVNTRCWYLFGKLLLLKKEVLKDCVVIG